MIGSLSRTTPVIVAKHHRTHGAQPCRADAGLWNQHCRWDLDPNGYEGGYFGVPVFGSCADAVLTTGAVASVAMAPPAETLAAVQEALAAGIKLIVTVAEGGLPLHDAIRIGRAVQRAGAVWVGASTPGLAVPGACKLGFLPDVCLHPGPIGIMSKSGTLSYEVGYRLVREGSGQSIWVGVGGDAVKGVRFADLLPVLFDDARTKVIVLVGEVGVLKKKSVPMPICGWGGASRFVRADRGTGGEGGRLDGSCRCVGAWQVGDAEVEDAAADRGRGRGIRVD